MRAKTLLLAVLVVAVGSGLFSNSTMGASMRRGSVAPDFTLPDLDGNQVSLSDFKGKVVVVAFWATFCRECKLDIPHLRNYYKKYQNKDAVLLSLSLDSETNEFMKKFAKRWEITYPILMVTPNVTKQWRVRFIPITFMVNQKGLIEHTYIGPEATGLLDRDTRKLLAK